MGKLPPIKFEDKPTFDIIKTRVKAVEFSQIIPHPSCDEERVHQERYAEEVAARAIGDFMLRNGATREQREPEPQYPGAQRISRRAWVVMPEENGRDWFQEHVDQKASEAREDADKAALDALYEIANARTAAGRLLEADAIREAALQLDRRMREAARRAALKESVG